MNRPRRTALLLVAALPAALLLAASPAPARGPSTGDQGSLDWILERFARDREEENRGAAVVDPVEAFRHGQAPLEGEGGWKAMVALVYSPTEKPGRKSEAAAAMAERFKLEDERVAKAADDRRAAEAKALAAVKVQVVRETYKGMLGSNQVILACVLRIQKALLPPEWVNWNATDTLKIRRKAYEDLSKRVK